MKKLSLYIFLVLMWCNVGFAIDTWKCKNYRFGKVYYHVDDSLIEMRFPNGDGRVFKIKIDQREYKISVYGEYSNKETNFNYDVYLDYQDRYAIVRTQDALSGYSSSYKDTDCSMYK